jgi:predicted enzyme related to lactoylglutathione lyase
MSRVIHFEIYTDDPETVRPFYQDVFGWKFQRFGGPRAYWLVTKGNDKEPGIVTGSLALAKVRVLACAAIEAFARAQVYFASTTKMSHSPCAA